LNNILLIWVTVQVIAMAKVTLKTTINNKSETVSISATSNKRTMISKLNTVSLLF